MEIVRGHSCSDCAEASLAASGVNPDAPRADMQAASEAHAADLSALKQDAVAFAGQLKDVQIAQAVAPVEDANAARPYTPGTHLNTLA